MKSALFYSAGATQNSVSLTVAIRSPVQPQGWRIEASTAPIPLAPHPWPPPPNPPLCWFELVAIKGLADGRLHTFGLVDPNGAVVARCSARTLPAALPPAGSPFRVLLASCFSLDNDEGVGDALLRLPAAGQPHLRIFCGDQVYADAGRTRLWLGDANLRRALLNTYWRSFSQSPRGFGDFLGAGTNFFLSDDHEFWNNAPYPTATSMNAFTQAGVQRWRPLARQLYREFQGNYQKMFGFDIAPLSVRLLDTRINRDDQLTALCPATELNALHSWVQGLKGPGVLVLGQPIFAEPAKNPTGKTGDAALQNYRGYIPLFQAIAKTSRPIVILTGDVHFGRVAWCRPAPLLPPKLIEVISSPLAQITFAKGSWQEAPNPFGATHTAFAGAVSETAKTWWDEKDHFVTLDFERVGGTVRMRLQRWNIPMDRPVPVDTLGAFNL